MVWRSAVLSLFGAMLVASSAFSQQELLEEPVPEKREVFYDRGDLVLVEGEDVTRFITPRILSEYGRFQLKIHRPKPKSPDVEELPAERALADRIEARRIMHEANQAFFKGEIARAWELVAQAETLDPSFYRIKTMKGSLLYKIGSKDLAMEVWRESLAQNPDQPEIVLVLKGIAAENATRPTVATGVSSDEKKASLQ